MAMSGSGTAAPPAGTVPVVDMAAFLGTDAPAQARAARRFGEAFEQTGFAAVVGHGVDEALCQRMDRLARAFFDLPLADKLAVSPPEQVKGRGYLPMGIESVAATLAGETPPDLCEALVFASLEREAQGLGPPNLWPSSPEGLADTVREWFAALRALCDRLMRMAALALDLPADWFAEAYAPPALTLRFVHYPDQPQPPALGQLRYGAHHDYGGLTILRQDDAPGGLEICDRQGRWQAVPNLPGSFLINVGDLMARWTNDRWRSTLHRVVNPDRALTGSTRRLSMVAFTGPREDTIVRCLPSCQAADRPARYEPVRAGDYVRAKLASSMELKTPPRQPA